MTLSAGVAGLAWAGFMLALAGRLRPRRCGPLVASRRRSRCSRPRATLGPAVERIGHLLVSAACRPAATPARARGVGAAALATVVALALTPLLAPAPALVAVVLPRAAARRRERRRLIRMESSLPETVDLLRLAVGAGCNVSLAVAAAGRRGVGQVAAELRRVTEEVGLGRRLADALEELPARAGETTRPLVAALVGAERYGSPLGPALERLSEDVRRQRLRRAEEAARKVPVALLFPLVLCILPAFALLTVAPLIAGAFRELGL